MVRTLASTADSIQFRSVGTKAWKYRTSQIVPSCLYRTVVRLLWLGANGHRNYLVGGAGQITSGITTITHFPPENRTSRYREIHRRSRIPIPGYEHRKVDIAIQRRDDSGCCLVIILQINYFDYIRKLIFSIN